MKFLILGCNGMAGHMISLYLHEKGHDVLGFARKQSKYVPCVIGDARDTIFLRALIGSGRFDSVINCIGVLNQFAGQNRERAVYLNAYLPHFLVLVTKGMPTQVIHLSTDCVFSGKRGQYTEDDFPDGKTFYARTKALGELDDGKNITVRSSIVGPDINPSGIGLLNWFLQQRGEVNGYTGAVWSGQTTLQLAKTIEAAARGSTHGLYHMVPRDSITKFELLELFNSYLLGKQVKINPVCGVNADKSLKRMRFDFDYQIPDYETMVSELAAWMRNHKDMYPHYTL